MHSSMIDRLELVVSRLVVESLPPPPPQQQTPSIDTVLEDVVVDTAVVVASPVDDVDGNSTLLYVYVFIN